MHYRSPCTREMHPFMDRENYTGISLYGCGLVADIQSYNIHVLQRLYRIHIYCMCVYVCMCVCMHVCVCMCVYVCMYACMHVFVFGLLEYIWS